MAAGETSCPSASACVDRGARRLRDTDRRGAAPDPLGVVRRSEPGEPGLLPELGTGRDGVELPERGRGGIAAAAHLVDVGAGPVLHRPARPGADACRSGAQAAGRATSTGVHHPAEHSGRRLVRLRDRSPPRRPGNGLLRQLRPRLGTACRRPGGRAGVLCPVADVASDRIGNRRTGGGAVLWRAHRRRHAVPRSLGAGAGGSYGAANSGRGQPHGRPCDAWPTALSQSGAGDRATGRAGLDGVLALSVALAAADLLARLHRGFARHGAGRRDHFADLRLAGLSDHAFRRGATARATYRCHGTGQGMAAAVAPADHRRGDGRRAARSGADRHILQLAGTRCGATRRRRSPTGRAGGNRLPGRARTA